MLFVDPILVYRLQLIVYAAVYADGPDFLHLAAAYKWRYTKCFEFITLVSNCSEVFLGQTTSVLS